MGGVPGGSTEGAEALSGRAIAKLGRELRLRAANEFEAIRRLHPENSVAVKRENESAGIKPAARQWT
jgi:hypothetical protein